MPDNKIVHSTTGSSIGDILERILDKGVVIAGDISVSIAGVELLTIKIRLVVASIDKAVEMGINWWRNDPYLSLRAGKYNKDGQTRKVEEDNKAILERLNELESKLQP